MGVVEILTQIRDYYLARLTGAAEEAAADADSVVLEPCLRDSEGNAVREGEHGLGMRVDVVVIAAGDAVRTLSVETDRELAFPAVTFAWSPGLEVVLRGFAWQRCPLRLAGSALNPRPLFEWFEKWFDADDERPLDERGLQGVVHFMSDPAMAANSMILEVDFGSAPIEAVEELLDVAATAGASTIEFGHA